jgi:L-aminopeptidase/D-esterase-like protein
MALLEPAKTIERVHAISLTGGSAFGLPTAHGVMRYLAEQGRGFKTPHAVVPIVPAAAIYDLSIAKEQPTEQAGYEAAQQASSKPIQNGLVGAGRGASCGKYLPAGSAARGGLGNALVQVGESVVAALCVANPLGDIVDPRSGEVVAGACTEDGQPASSPRHAHLAKLPFGGNTTLVVVATNAQLSKRDAHMLADSAHIGIAHVTYPSHTPHDGDTCFVLSTGDVPAVPLLALSVAVQEVVSEAILNAARASNR